MWKYGLLVVLLGCGDDTTAPGDRVPALGRYAYTFTSGSKIGFSGRQFTGVLVLTYADPDSIAGHWDVPTGIFTVNGAEIEGYESELHLGFWNVDAYVVYAHTVAGIGIITHRVRRAGTGLHCEAHVLLVLGGGSVDTVPGTCVIGGPE